MSDSISSIKSNVSAGSMATNMLKTNPGPGDRSSAKLESPVHSVEFATKGNLVNTTDATKRINQAVQGIQKDAAAGDAAATAAIQNQSNQLASDQQALTSQQSTPKETLKLLG